MTTFLLPALVGVGTAIALRLWYVAHRKKVMRARRRVEQPNSAYSSLGVRNREDRERWAAIDLPGLHPINREEVLRLLDVADHEGVAALSVKDRLFLDNMTLPRGA